MPMMKGFKVNFFIERTDGHRDCLQTYVIRSETEDRAIATAHKKYVEYLNERVIGKEVEEIAILTPTRS